MKSLAPLFALAVITSPALALAAVPYDTGAAQGDVQVVHVSDRGLDLTRAHDASVMLQRISTAALEACGASDFSLAEYRRVVMGSACYRDGVDQAVRQLHAAGATALVGQDGVRTGLAAGAN